MATRRQTETPDLKPKAVAVLLDGWGAEPPKDTPEGAHGFGGGILECFMPDGPARLWREHESWLRRIAQAWGWTPSIIGPDGVRRFYAEHCAAGYPKHPARR